MKCRVRIQRDRFQKKRLRGYGKMNKIAAEDMEYINTRVDHERLDGTRVLISEIGRASCRERV